MTILLKILLFMLAINILFILVVLLISLRDCIGQKKEESNADLQDESESDF